VGAIHGNLLEHYCAACPADQRAVIAWPLVECIKRRLLYHHTSGARALSIAIARSTAVLRASFGTLKALGSKIALTTFCLSLFARRANNERQKRR